MPPLKKLLGLGAWCALGLFGLAYAIALNGTEPAPVSPYGAAQALSSAPRRDGVAIAPLREALTFARFRDASGLRLMRVSRYEHGMVSGVDITAAQPGGGEPDPITLWQRSDYEAIAAADGPAVSLPAAALAVPFASTTAQVGMGGTYPAHAGETRIPRPFVFPKLLAAQAWNVPVPSRTFLLDYEIELGVVALQALKPGERPSHFGLVLASDYTDRDRLLRDLNIGDVSTGLAFAAAKSLVPAMPVGALFVIPKDVRTFHRKLELRLHVNDRLRQVAMPKDLTWDLDRMLQETFARRDLAFPMGRNTVKLPIAADGTLPARTILLSGTTDGVVVRPPSARQLFIGVTQWLVSLRWTTPSLMVDRMLLEAHADGHYLQPGDEVLMRAEYLGLIANTIVP
ncbi:fumarylacetoacetate hydrolase family protein [Mitsuaria sp. GD03876]|uniref:fumarylacetoacetate hydrolase family protein n=1 Tax=Mitsuaria sp. GD03876 TaxID=2975399 RepID=UPI0024472785|nr:fumarylacetoacetate hydrolase family protein [Mitsuaria sp. GD03876]MDH0864321.1 fumarylacetoacetate hydrolase family protein [Mitsuaria sp. GD03876]